MNRFRAVVVALLLGIGGCAAAPLQHEVTTSPATTEAQADLVDVSTLAPDIDIDMRYAGTHNFTGGIVDGYDAPRCLLLRPAAEALAKVQASLRMQHMRLRVYDCYRPVRAVQAFMRWVDDEEAQATKPEFYPDLEKAQLRGGYIAAVSGHSRGATIDLGLLQCKDDDTRCEPLDMGTPFDFFGERANTDFPGITDAQRGNRQRLREAMEHAGFANYPMEWWHYTLKPEPTPLLQYDVPITRQETTMLQAKVDRLMQRYDGDVPGASLLVLKDGEAVVRRGYGRADIEQGIEAGPATDYRLASVSKQFTAAAILLLAQDGKLRIDDPIRKWLPTLPAAAAITLRHVLTHTSGLVDYEDLMADDYKGQIRDAGVLELLAQENRLYFTPGSAYRYSNSGYALLSLVVERASGMGYPAFVQQRIFAPLGMHDTLAYVVGGADVNHRAFGYSEADGTVPVERWQRTDQSTTSAVLGDGGIYSSIDDLARWDAALYDDRLLSDASRAMALSPQVEVTGEPYQASYGFGWRISGDMLWHSGETIGFRNVILRWPTQHLTVILLSNRNDPEPYAAALEVAKLFMAK